MGRDLSEMSLEELWELFPIFLVAHDDRWKDSFHEIEKTLTALLADSLLYRLSHIGSTAIRGIWAKTTMICLNSCRSLKTMNLKATRESPMRMAESTFGSVWAPRRSMPSCCTVPGR